MENMGIHAVILPNCRLIAGGIDSGKYMQGEAKIAQLCPGPTIIAGSEIAGAVAEVRLIAGDALHYGKFGTDGVAIVPLDACVS